MSGFNRYWFVKIKPQAALEISNTLNSFSADGWTIVSYQWDGDDYTFLLVRNIVEEVQR